MRIACITTSVVPSKSANSIQAMKVAHALHELGQDIRLWVPDFARAEWPRIAEIYGLSKQFDIEWVPFLPAAKRYDFCWCSVKKALGWKADVIYTWSLQAAVFALIRKIPAVIEFHDFPMGLFGPRLFKLLMRLQGHKLILTTTRALAEGLEEEYHFNFKPEELQIAPNGTEPRRYENLPSPKIARSSLGFQNRFTVGYTGHFYAGRGADLLLDLALGLPNINFLWIGGRDKDIEPWREKLVGMGIKNVKITGFIPKSQLPAYQAAADILVMPYSRKISGSSGGSIERVINPMKMFDYLAAGRAIVASDIPVFHEVLNPEIAEFCEPENSSDWVETIKKLKDDPQRLKQLSASAKRVAEKYSWKNRAQETITRLEKIIK
jgi:glycosyltransferase involved in cell wall biosynthesis